MPVVYGIDLGTSGCKLTALSPEGTVVATASASYPTASPARGYQEQDPADWWSAFVDVTASVRSLAGPPAAIALTGQMHSLVALSRDADVLRPAILWSDTRAAAESREASARFDFEAVTGNPLIPAFTLAHLLWMRAHEPRLYSRIGHILQPKDHLRLRLTGAMLTDPSDASGTAMFDIGDWSWSRAILATFEIAPEWLAPCVASGAVSAHGGGAAAAALGLEGVPLVTGAGDQSAQAIGMGVTEPGVLGVSLGTSGVITMTATEPVAGSFCHALPGRWLRLESMHTAGSSLTWFHDSVAREVSIDDLLAEAAAAPPGCDELLYLPFLLGERRSHGGRLAAAFLGLGMAHSRPHLVRSILEGVAFEIRRMAERWERDGARITSIRLAGGGARSGLWQHILADVLGMPVGLSGLDASGGAARLAADALGWTAPTLPLPAAQVTEPEPGNVAIYHEAYGRYRTAVTQAESGEAVTAG